MAARPTFQRALIEPALQNLRTSQPSFLWAPTSDSGLYREEARGLVGRPNSVSSNPSYGGIEGPLAGSSNGIVFDTNAEITAGSFFFIGIMLISVFDPLDTKGSYLKIGGDSDGLGFGIGNNTFEDQGSRMVVLKEGVSWNPAVAGTYFAHGLNVISFGRTNEQIISYTNHTTGVGLDVTDFSGAKAIAPSSTIFINGYTAVRGAQDVVNCVAIFPKSLNNGDFVAERLRLTSDFLVYNKVARAKWGMDAQSLFQPTRKLFFFSAGLSPISSDRLVEYNLRALAQSNASLLYNIRAALQKDAAINYSLRELIQSNRSANYNIRSLTTSDTTPSYLIRSALQKSLSEAYNINASLNKDLTASYDILNALASVQSDKTILYDILSSINSSLFENYNLRQAILSSASPSYNIRASITSDDIQNYLIRQFVLSTQNTTYNIRSNTFSSFSVTYDILSATSVASNLIINYNIRSILSKDSAYSYYIRQSIIKDGAVSYVINVSTSSSTSQEYLIRSALPKDLSENYNLRSLVNSNITASYIIEGLSSVSSDLTALYNVLTEVLPGSIIIYVKDKQEVNIFTENPDSIIIYVK